MRKPKYSIQARDSDRSTCIDCRGATARVSGHRNGKPICDVCLLQQDPQLGALVAAQSTIEALAKAARPPRPKSRTVLRMLLEQARSLGAFFDQSWSTANSAEVKLSTAYDLSMVEERARTLGGEDAARQFEDLPWVRRSIEEAERHGAPVKGYLLIAAIERVGKRVQPPMTRKALLETTDSAVFG